MNYHFATRWKQELKNRNPAISLLVYVQECYQGLIFF